jgi:hypothetical protein
MGTLKFPDVAQWEWGGVSVFSGRPDPVWPITPEFSDSITSLWNEAELSETAPPPPPQLGYRGSFVKDVAMESVLQALDGFVTLERASGKKEYRIDAGRAIEKKIIQSAPQGLLPDFISELAEKMK